MQRIPGSSVDYLKVPVSETTENIDPTGLPVHIALIPYQYMVGQTIRTEPTDNDWQVATWAPGGPPWTARVLLDDSVEGDHQVWIRVTADPEIPVRRAGRIVKGDYQPDEGTGTGTGS